MFLVHVLNDFTNNFRFVRSLVKDLKRKVPQRERPPTAAVHYFWGSKVFFTT